MAHRNLKFENILVKSRYPFFIKLADFNLANNKHDLKIFYGFQDYAAPEIYFRNKYNKIYTTAVDLWSLDVIALQYLYGFPNAAAQKPREK
jgi:serine/threonine protein kinase